MKKVTASAAAVAVVVKKSTKGVPRITDKVIALDADGRVKWLADSKADAKYSTCTAAQWAEVEKRLASAVAGERQPRKIDFASAFKGRSIKELNEARQALDAAVIAAGSAEETKLNEILARAQQELDTIRAARKTTLVPATA